MKHKNSDGPSMMKDLVVLAFIGAIAVLLAGLFVGASLDTGPNCPDMDPSWLGWCE